MNFTMLFNLPYHLFSLLTLPPNQMASLNRNPEDRTNKGDLNIPSQTQILQAMVPIMVKSQQHVTLQASFPRSHNHVSNDNQVPTGLPAFDKEKLLAMQACVLQGRLQSKTPTPDNMEMTKAEFPTGPVKRQVAEAWNNEKRKRNYEAPKPQIEE